MKLKSYFSGTVEAAIESAHKELGEDALLVNVRPTAIETRHLGAYEVVFGVPGALHGTAETSSRSSPGERTTPDRLTQDVADLRRQMARISDTLRGSRGYSASFAAGSAAARSETCARLIAAELDPELAQLVAHGTPLEELCLADPTLGRPESGRAVVAFVGPPGSGKTTTLAKLAARCGIAGRKRTHILSADVCRIAAAEQLRSLAAILGLGFDVVETPIALRQALEEHRLKDLVLIDTPGLGWADLEEGRDLALTLTSLEDIDTHLVLPASMKPADIARIAGEFSMFHPSKLLFTRLDETTRFGALVSESVRSAKPISFLTNGQEIPDAIESATPSRLAALVQGEPEHPDVSAALTQTAGVAA